MVQPEEGNGAAAGSPRASLATHVAPRDLVVGVASVLDYFVAQHIQTGAPDPPSPFDAPAIPDTTMEEFLEHVMAAGLCSKECFVIALIYGERILQRNPGMVITRRNAHRLVLVSILVASKILDDFYCRNTYYASTGGMTTKELNALEVQFCFMLGFKLNVTRDEFDVYCNTLSRDIAPALPQPAVEAAAAPTWEQSAPSPWTVLSVPTPSPPLPATKASLARPAAPSLVPMPSDASLLPPPWAFPAEALPKATAASAAAAPWPAPNAWAGASAAAAALPAPAWPQPWMAKAALDPGAAFAQQPAPPAPLCASLPLPPLVTSSHHHHQHHHQQHHQPQPQQQQMQQHHQPSWVPPPELYPHPAYRPPPLPATAWAFAPPSHPMDPLGAAAAWFGAPPTTSLAWGYA